MPYNSDFGGTVNTTLPTVTGLTGGTANKAVRFSGTNVVTDASNTDAFATLYGLLFKDGNGNYVQPGGIVETLSGLTVGSVYYLGTAGNITLTPPTPTASVVYVVVGRAISTGRLYFVPTVPITG